MASLLLVPIQQVLQHNHPSRCKTENSTAIYRNWPVQQSATYPLFFIDARVKDDVLLLLEALIATAEIQITH